MHLFEIEITLTLFDSYFDKVNRFFSIEFDGLILEFISLFAILAKMV